MGKFIKILWDAPYTAMNCPFIISYRRDGHLYAFTFKHPICAN